MNRAEEYQAFLDKHPEYASTAGLDELRAREFSRLDAEGHVYLDYTGGGLYSESLVRRHVELLQGTVLGNPHSTNPAAAASTKLVEGCRERVARFFSASRDEYAVIFTANASHALKLVGESYPFSPGDQFLLTFDNHNSVNGIREFDRAHGAKTRYIPLLPPDMQVADAALEPYLDEHRSGRNNLFAYPAQSNFSGVQHPLTWVEKAKEKGWDVLLDAAAFVPTNRLDLGTCRPDFVALSFYKMFGYPTGIGALIARRSALEKLHRPWFAGGTITVASVQADRFYQAFGAEGFEDGTLNYTGLPAVAMGLDFMEEIGIDVIHTRVKTLTGWLITRLLELKHSNGRPLVRLYGPAGTKGRGGSVALNLYDASGRGIDHGVVERRANEHRISLRTGCFCNPGAGEMALGLGKSELDSCFANNESRMSLDEFRQCIDGKSTGAVRISLGMVSSFADVETVIECLGGFRQNG